MRLLVPIPARRRGTAVALVFAGVVAAVAVILCTTGAPGPSRVPGNRAASGAAGANAAGWTGAPVSAEPSVSAAAPGAAPSSPASTAPPGGHPPGPGWTLMWSPSAPRDGLGAFEGIEDDRANSDPGRKHIYVQGNVYRFDMPAGLRDTSPDRQRNEVKGMHANGQNLSLGLGETWRLDWSIYIPNSLQGTTGFSHIMQLKMPGGGVGPILTMSLNRRGSEQRIVVKIFEGGIVIGAADLVPLHNTWLDNSLTFTIADAPKGMVSWRLSKGATVVVNSTKTGLDTWMQDRVRPKWGIYRSVKGFDNAYPLADCFILMTNLRAYKKA
jgi:hypothetical protein